MHFHCHLETTEQLAFRVFRVPSLRLRNSPDIRRTCLDRRPLLGDNHLLPMTSSACQRILQERIAGPTFLLLLVWQAYTKSSPQIPELMCCPFFHAICISASFRRRRCRIYSSKINRKSLRALGKVGSPQCAGKKSRSLRSRSLSPSVCHMSTLLLGHMSNSDPDDCSNISATNFTPSNSSCRLPRSNQQQRHHDQTSFYRLL